MDKQQLHIIERDSKDELQQAINKFLEDGKFRMISLSITKEIEFFKQDPYIPAETKIHYEAWTIIQRIGDE